MHGYVCTMEFRKRGTPVASVTPKFACRRMCARLHDHCDGSAVSSCLLPARKKERKTQTDRGASPPDLARRRTQETTHAGSAGKQAGQKKKAAGPTRSWSMPSTRGFPARAHPRATPQTGRSGLRAASRGDVLPLTRPRLVCACLPFSPDHASLPREHADGRDSVTMSLWPSRVPAASNLGLRSPSRPGRV